MTTRIRYNRDKLNRPKDTLITIEQEGRIYFGISRCNIKADRPLKHEGRRIAEERAKEICDNESNEIFQGYPTRGRFHIQHDGLSGVCDVRNVKLLLEYFHDIRAQMTNG